MTEEEKTVVVKNNKSSIKEALIVLALSTVAGLVTDLAINKGVESFKTRRANKAEVAAVEQ